MTDPQLSLFEFGDPGGAPIVALHGGAKTAQHWTRIGTEGLPWRRWICPDLRSHGTSPSGHPPHTLTQMAGDVLTAADAQGVERFDIIGHSLGGRVAAEICKQSPDRVESAVLLDPPVMTRDEYLQFHERKSQTRFEEWLVKDFATVDEMIAELQSAHQDQRLPPDARAHVELEAEGWLSPSADGRFRFRVDLDVLHSLIEDCAANLPPDFGEYCGRALLLVSGQFGICTDAGHRALRRQLGDRLSTIVIDDASHNLLWDAYPRTVSEVINFLG